MTKTPAALQTNDSVIAEIHQIRAALQAEFKGDLHAYGVAAQANAQKLGFKFPEVQGGKSAQPPLTSASAM